jgi:hypothetical protein
LKSRYLILFFLLIILINYNIHPQEKVLQAGESLVYTVYFGFIKLGEVRFYLNSPYYENRRKIYSASAKMFSYEGIPFVGVKYFFDSKMRDDKTGVVSEEFRSSDFKDESSGGKMIIRTEYDFDYYSNKDTSTVKIKKYKDTDPGNPEMDTVYRIEKGKEYLDGLTILYNARLNSFQKGSEGRKNIKVFINEKESSLRYSFDQNRDAVSTGLVDYDMAGIRIAGVADFVGVMGLTGEFEGWFSDDDGRVPLKARLNILIGSVTLELKSYVRPGWYPPKFSN